MFDRGEHLRQADRQNDHADHLDHRDDPEAPVVRVVGGGKPGEIYPGPADGETRKAEAEQGRGVMSPPPACGRTGRPPVRSCSRRSGRTAVRAGSPPDAARGGRARSSAACDDAAFLQGKCWRSFRHPHPGLFYPMIRPAVRLQGKTGTVLVNSGGRSRGTGCFLETSAGTHGAGSIHVNA